MAPKKKTGTTEKKKPTQNADGLRRSVRQQEQRSNANAISVSSKITKEDRLPTNAKKGRKSKESSGPPGKPTAQPVAQPAKKGRKGKTVKQTDKSKPVDDKAAEKAGDAVTVPLTGEALFNFIREHQPPHARANRNQSEPLKEKPNSPKLGPNKGISSGPKRKLDKEKAQDARSNEPCRKSPKPLSESHDRSESVRTFRTLLELRRTGWLITDNFLKKFCCTDTVPPSRIPSPLANLDDQQRSALHFVEHHAPVEVRLLFQEICSDSQYYRRELRQRFELNAQGVFIEFLYGTHPVHSGSSNQHDDETITVRDHVWLSGVLLYKATLGEFHDGARFKAYAIGKAETDDRGQFVPSTYDTLIINESVYGQYLLAGPLPDFAILQIEDHTLFWWRNLEALDYVPDRDAMRSVEHGGLPSTSNLPQSSNVEWNEILDQGLARHRGRMQSSTPTIKSNEPHQIPGYRDLNMDNVLLAIASIWDALRRRNRVYAFAGSDVLDTVLVASRLVTQRIGVVGGSSQFLMPIFLQTDKSAHDKDMAFYNHSTEGNKSKKSTPAPSIGHIVLAVAERDSDVNHRVNISIFDSRIGTLSESKIQGIAAAIAADYGWQGFPEHEEDVSLATHIRNVTEYQNPEVPQQPEASNACGLFTILNAWAFMLHIPLHEGRRRRGRHSNQEFLETGVELVNLALAGFMDSRTIQAFLNVFGLSVLQNAADFEENANTEINAVRMNPTIFRRALTHQLHKDRDFPSPTRSLSKEAEEHSPPQSSGENVQQEDPFDEDAVQMVIAARESQTTRRQAVQALREANGDFDGAMAVLAVHSPTSESPNN